MIPRSLIASVALLALAVSLGGCVSNPTPDAASPAPASSGVEATDASATAPISLDEARVLVERHVDALAAGNAQAFEATLSSYKQGLSGATSWGQEVRKWKGVEVASVTTPGRHVSTAAALGSYRQASGRKPYRLLVVNVAFTSAGSSRSPDMPTEWDYIIVQASPDSPLLIHDWGY